MNLENIAARDGQTLNRRVWYLAATLIFFALLLGNWDLVTGQALPQWDSADFFGPEFSLVADHIKAGRFLLWNPWVGAGNPDFAEPELGTTSPILLLVGFLSPNPQIGFVSYWLLIWFLGGIGMLFLARSLGAPAWGATVVSLAFITSGLYTGHAEHTSSIYSSSFLPWILWRFNLALDKGRYWYAVQAGALYGLSALGGYPEFTILTPLFLGVWATGHVLFATRFSSRRLIRASFFLVLLVVIGGLIFSPSYVGIVQSTHGFSDRVGTRSRIESVSSNILAVGALTTFASPYLALLNYPPKGIWPRSDVSMTSIYVCPALLIFALFAWRRSTFRWWLAAVAIVLLCCCLGDQLPVRGWMYDLVPPTRYFRNPSLFRAYVILLLSAVGALGIRDFTSLDFKRRERFVFSGLSGFVVLACLISFASVVLIYGRYFDGYAIDHIPFFSLAVAQLAITGVGIVTITLLLLLNAISVRLAGRLLLAVALIDAVSTLRISKPTMYSEAPVPWWHEENSQHVKSVNLGEAGLARQLTAPPAVATYPNDRNIPLRISTFNSYITLSNRFQQQYVADPILNATALGPNRFWFAPEPASLPPTDSAFQSFRQKMHISSSSVMTIQTDQQMRVMTAAGKTPSTPNLPSSIGDQALCSRAKITDVNYGPNALAFSYRAAASGWLMVTDRWAPDWRVTVNGASQKIMGANFIFRAVRVNQGDNQIRFRYRPSFFIPLFVLSWTILLLIAIAQLARFPFTSR